MSEPFNPHLPCRTRSGRTVEILTVLPPEKASITGERIVALVDDREEGRTIETYWIDGRFSDRRETLWDLVNVPAPIVTLRQFTERLAARSRRVPITQSTEG